MFISPMVLILPFGKVGAHGESKLDWEALSATWDVSLEGKVFIVLLTLLPPLLGLLGAIQLSGEDGEALKELPKRALDALLRRDHEIEEDLRDGVAHPLRRVWWTPREKAYFKGYLVRAAGLLLVLSGILGALGLIGSSSPPQTNAAGYSRLRVICLLMMLGSLAGVALVWWGGKFEFGSHVDSERVTELRNAAAQSSPSAKIAIAHNAVCLRRSPGRLLAPLLASQRARRGDASRDTTAIARGAL